MQTIIRLLRSLWHLDPQQEDKVSVWLYDWPEGQGPLFVVAREWTRGWLRGVEVERVWRFEEEPDTRTDFDVIRSKLESNVFVASAIADGSMRRVGPFPSDARIGTHEGGLHA
jgi:hypothetical protein